MTMLNDILANTMHYGLFLTFNMSSPSSCFMACLIWSSVEALNTLLITDVEIRGWFNWSAFSNIFLIPSYNQIISQYHDKMKWMWPMRNVFFEIQQSNSKDNQLTTFCCNLAWVFFISKSSTITDCFWGSTTLPFIWNPFIRLAVLKLGKKY